MILSDIQIREAFATGRIALDPAPSDTQFAPSSIDLHAGREFRRWKSLDVALVEPVKLSSVNLQTLAKWLENLPTQADGSVIIAPGAFVLAQTKEKISLPHDSRLAARVEGRSSYPRLGLVVHMTAPTIHAGFSGTIVLEMMNFGPFPLVIEPEKTRICQLIFEELGSAPSGKVQTAFQNQAGVLGPIGSSE